MSFGARALIRLGALKHNLDIIRTATADSKIMAVIKANAYGHGMVTVAQHLDDVDAFAVARVPEAIQLRENSVTAPIVLLSGVIDEREMVAAVKWGLEPVVHCREQLDLLDATRAGSVNVWVKFDTGMNRLGFPARDADDIIKRLQSSAAVNDLRLMTHLSSADDLQAETTAEQLDRFWPIARGFEGDVSIGNTPGALGWPAVSEARKEFGFSGDNWIRTGIALFGISPFAGQTGVDLGLMPVMQFEARLIAIKPLSAGSRVGYKGTYVSDTDTKLGVISAGYGDGYTRHFRSGTPVLINDRIVSLIGHVSMDMIAVDLGADATDSVGDIATLWGDGLPVEKVAPWADTISYELVCGVMHREDSEAVK